MTELEFLSADRVQAFGDREPVFRSSLERALAHAGPEFRDISRMGKIQVRGDVAALDIPDGAELLGISARRALILCDFEDAARVRGELGGAWVVVDVTGALAGIEVSGERREAILRRLTDLDLDALPSAGKLADVPAILARSGDVFRVLVSQELGHYVAEVMLDVALGIPAGPAFAP